MPSDDGGGPGRPLPPSAAARPKTPAARTTAAATTASAGPWRRTGGGAELRRPGLSTSTLTMSSDGSPPLLGGAYQPHMAPRRIGSARYEEREASTHSTPPSPTVAPCPIPGGSSIRSP